MAVSAAATRTAQHTEAVAGWSEACLTEERDGPPGRWGGPSRPRSLLLAESPRRGVKEQSDRLERRVPQRRDGDILGALASDTDRALRKLEDRPDGVVAVTEARLLPGLAGAR